MAHLHQLRDTDTHFTVDPITRTIKNGNSSKNMLVQHDHNSEIFTFEMPRYIEEHDMTTCNHVEVHYTNVGSAGQKNASIYTVKDLAASEDNPDVVVWSWLISGYATEHVGSLIFAFRFACVTDENVDYEWNTSPFSGIKIVAGVRNSEEVVKEYADILEQWENKIGVGIDDVKQVTRSYDDNGVNVITMILTDGKRRSFMIQNGRTPVRGEDYWTSEDKQEIINAILDVIPVAEEASF